MCLKMDLESPPRWQNFGQQSMVCDEIISIHECKKQADRLTTTLLSKFFGLFGCISSIMQAHCTVENYLGPMFPYNCQKFCRKLPKEFIPTSQDPEAANF